MIDLKILREQPKLITDAAKAKRVEIDIDRILELDRRVRALKSDSEAIAATKNEVSKRLPTVSAEERAKLIGEMRETDRQADNLRAELSPISEELDELLYKIPNPALPDVTVSPDEKDNEVVRVVGEKPVFDFQPQDHMTIGEKLGIIDSERATKTSGARFTYLKGDGALLELALVSYALTVAAKHGFTPMMVPHLVTAKAMRAMGYLEHGGHEEIYYLAKDNLYLIGTAEQSIGPMHMDEIIPAENLPLRYIGFSPCYRREAGSYGKDTKGILRVHQFDKVEMFTFSEPGTSDAEHELILSIEEELMQGLKIPYHVLKMVTGDLGLPAARKYDIEAWLPSQETYRETHSSSSCTDFQARRLNTRYKKDGEKPEFLHTLNGTAFAIGRTIIAILENYQQADGSVIIPEILIPFMGGKSKLSPKV